EAAGERVLLAVLLVVGDGPLAERPAGGVGGGAHLPVVSRPHPTLMDKACILPRCSLLVLVVIQVAVVIDVRLAVERRDDTHDRAAGLDEVSTEDGAGRGRGAVHRGTDADVVQRAGTLDRCRLPVGRR